MYYSDADHAYLIRVRVTKLVSKWEKLPYIQAQDLVAQALGHIDHENLRQHQSQADTDVMEHKLLGAHGHALWKVLKARS